MQWKETTIGKHCTVTSSKRFHLSERSSEGIPFYCSKEIIQKVSGQEITECDFIRKELYEDIKKQFGVPQTGDLLITTRGTYGVPYIYRDTDSFYFADGNLTWLKDFDEELSPQYLYYWVKSYIGQKCFDAIAKGTAQKAVPISAIKQLEIMLPPISIQHKIADILSAYDDLLENNQKQIKLLEEAAQRLFKEWFVDLRFLGHESVKVIDGVPEGWKNVTIGDVIAHEIGGGWGEDMPTGKQDQEAFVIRGTDFYAITHGAYMNIPFRYHSLSNLKERTLMDNDILFEVSGGSKTEGVAKTVLIKQELLREWNKPVICASFCKLIRLIDNSFSQYLFDHLQYLRNIGKTEMYDKRSASSIVNYRWKDFLTQEKMLLPSRKVLLHYNESAETIYKKIINCSRNIKTAQEARDRLLPKLMSGELEV